MMDDIVTRIEKLKPHPTEAIILGFNFNDTNVRTMNEVFDYVKSKFPNNVVVAIPDYVNIESCSKNVLENIISAISVIIDGL